MLRILIAVDGSESSAHAAAWVIENRGQFKEAPEIDLLAVHLPIPHVPRMGLVVSPQAIEAYYEEECAAMPAPSRKLLDAADIRYRTHHAVGQIAETIVEEARKRGSTMICMGTRGMSAISNMMLGSVATKVLHLAHVPVLLVR